MASETQARRKREVSKEVSTSNSRRYDGSSPFSRSGSNREAGACAHCVSYGERERLVT